MLSFRQNQSIADILVNSDCYKKSESGIMLPDGQKVPVYLSCRKLISDSNARKEIETRLSNSVIKNSVRSKVVVGLATAGIVWAHKVADEMNLPMLYVRSSEKGYGIGGKIEGGIDRFADGIDEAVIIDDVLHTGNSVFSAIEELESYNIKVSAVACIVSLNHNTEKQLNNKGIQTICLTDYEQLISSAIDNRRISKSDGAVMLEIYRLYERSSTD